MSSVSLPAKQGSLLRRAAQVIGLLESLPYWVLGLAARVFPAAVFWQSGQTKIEGWHLSDSAIALFQDEYKLPLVDPTAAAYAAAFAEHFFPILLVLGLASRFAAFSLLIMTSIIEIFVYPDAWPTHGVWATCFLLVITRGPGLISLDHFIAKHFGIVSRKAK
ncbi:DoxX family protein [uncultured Methylovirgula sp.]|uniref:DoxX family protein n=1 Tax=uncultured Methylovirgula sp. TaxID=1285960 RepID=UPI00262136DF|nr:DoxX family protein [uncultured Methylovirgula sp.]